MSVANQLLETDCNETAHDRMLSQTKNRKTCNPDPACAAGKPATLANGMELGKVQKRILLLTQALIAEQSSSHNQNKLYRTDARRSLPNMKIINPDEPPHPSCSHAKFNPNPSRTKTTFASDKCIPKSGHPRIKQTHPLRFATYRTCPPHPKIDPQTPSPSIVKCQQKNFESTCLP